ncbi:MAG: hypothetical protein SGILL_000460, partial [Bacillariaceae sp.]
DYYDLEDISNRLRSSMREPHVEQLVLSELQLEPCVIQALVNLLKTRDGEGDAWEAVFLEFCRGDVETAIREILALDNVKKLEIATGMSDRTAMQALSTAPRTYQTLQQLSLFTHIDEQAIEWLSEGFLRNAGISTLCFVKCTFLEGSTEPLARFLRSTQTIEVLRIDRCIMQDTDGNLGTILDSLAGHTSLNDLFIGGPLCEQSYLAISKLLTHNRLMFKLSLQNRSDLASSGRPSVCQDPTIQWMEDPLSSNSTLKILDLSQRCLNDDGMKVLCKALCSDASRLEEIRLHENHIGNIGAQHFASSIPSMTSSLRRILLHRNPFGEPGAKALLAAVRESCAVRELTIPSMGRSSLMTKYQRLISYETMLSCGGKHLLKGTIQNNLDSSLPAGLWPLIFERAGQQMSTPYSERQLSGSDAWKLTQQADLVFYLMKGAAESIFPRKRPDETS